MLMSKQSAYVNKRGVPIYSLICTSAVSLVCFLTSWIPGAALFLVLSSLAGIAGLVSAQHIIIKYILILTIRNIK